MIVEGSHQCGSGRRQPRNGVHSLPDSALYRACVAYRRSHEQPGFSRSPVGALARKVAMVFDERSLRTRQRPVRSGALRGAKSEISQRRLPCPFAPVVLAPARQPTDFNRLLPVKDQKPPESLPVCLPRTRPDATKPQLHRAVLSPARYPCGPPSCLCPQPPLASVFPPRRNCRGRSSFDLPLPAAAAPWERT